MKVLNRREVFESLGEVVNPKHAALVVVDMQKDFCTPGGNFNHINTGGEGIFKLFNMGDDNYLVKVILNGIYRLFNFFYTEAILSAKALINNQGGKRCPSSPGCLCPISQQAKIVFDLLLC